MPFNIELTKTKPIIKLQVSQNTITVYFHGEQEDVLRGMRSWKDLESHFIATMPECNRNWFRGPDAPHVKRNHTTEDEVKYSHFHQEFTSEVTPEILRTYLTNLWTQQVSMASIDKRYELFTDLDEVEGILNTFAIYYAEYKDSHQELQFNEQQTLTPSEESQYQQALTDSTRVHLNFDEDAIVMALLMNSLFATRKKGNGPMLNPEPTMDDENCLIM